jgi:hypothetical protein
LKLHVHIPLDIKHIGYFWRDYNFGYFGGSR